MEENTLLIIDVQKVFVEPPTRKEAALHQSMGTLNDLTLFSVDKLASIVGRIGAVADRVRGKAQIIWMAMLPVESGADFMSDNPERYATHVRGMGRPDLEIYDLYPQRGDLILSKKFPSAFSNSKLRFFLGNTRNLYVCGFNSSECVLATCREAKNLTGTLLPPNLELRAVTDMTADSYRGIAGFRDMRSDEDIGKIFTQAGIKTVSSLTLLEEILPERPGMNGKPGGAKHSLGGE